MSVNAFNHLKEWLTAPLHFSICCETYDRIEMIAIMCLRQRQSIAYDAETEWHGYATEVVYGKTWVRPASPALAS